MPTGPFPSPNRREQCVVIRVVIADDHPLVRYAVRSFLELESDFCVLAEAETGREAIDLVAAERPDVVLLDHQMPVLDGLAAARKIREAHPDVAIVMLTAEEHPAIEREAVAAGVHGFVRKNEPPEVLLDTIRTAAAPAEADRSVLTLIVEPEAEHLRDGTR